MQIRTFFITALVYLSANLAPAQAPFDSVLVIGSAEVFFEVNSHILQTEADSVLADLAEKCKTSPRRTLFIEAHTDADGGEQFNQALSERRAASVRSFLAEKGVPGEQMDVQAFGKKRPAAPNDSDQGKRLNRRVTIELLQRTQMAWLEGRVVDAKTGTGVQATVALRSRFTADSLQTDSAGHFRAIVPDRVPVEASFFAPGYFFETQMLQTGKPGALPLVVSLPPALEGEVFALQNFYFVGNQDTLLPASEPELPKLLKFMRFNPDIRIEIAGHINFPNAPVVPKESWNHQLSVRRAKRVFNFLLENGISEDRIIYRGYGNSQMVFPSARTEKEQAKNRRVEIRIMESNKK